MELLSMRSPRFSILSILSSTRSRVRLIGILQRKMRWSRSRGTARGWLTPCGALWTLRSGAGAENQEKYLNEIEIQLSHRNNWKMSKKNSRSDYVNKTILFYSLNCLLEAQWIYFFFPCFFRIGMPNRLGLHAPTQPPPTSELVRSQVSRGEGGPQSEC